MRKRETDRGRDRGKRVERETDRDKKGLKRERGGRRERERERDQKGLRKRNGKDERERE